MHARFSAAGDVLSGAGAASEGLEAYCRAEDWEGARRLLESRGAVVAERPSEWLESLPHALVRHDPWLLLAGARRARADGRLRDAANLYLSAESAFGSADAARLCRDERQTMSPWLGDTQKRRRDEFSLLRSAVQRQPTAVRADAQGLLANTQSLVSGLAALVAGNVATARSELIHAAERHDASRPVVVAASLGAGIAGALMGQPHAALEIEGAVAAAENAGIPWLARLGRASLAFTGNSESVREAEVIATASRGIGDEWGAALASLCSAWGALLTKQDTSAMDKLIVALRQLDAPVLEAWARAIEALAAVRAGEPEGSRDASAAVAVSRSLGIDGARLLAHLALAEATADPVAADEQRSEADALARETGMRIPVDAVALGSASRPKLSAGQPAMSIRMFGGFEFLIAGRPLDLSPIRPRARALLRLLALNAGHRLHHETIEVALWPEADATSSARNLHVAIAALRRVIEPAATRGSFQLIRREDDSYVVAAPDTAWIDVHEFDARLADGHRARASGDTRTAELNYEQALALYRGDLLPEDGPAEWAAERREQYRLAAVDATQALAEIVLRRGDAARAARVCSSGLHIERFHDPFWKLLIEARDQAGDQGAAHAARVGYDRMLTELGVSGPTGNSPQ